MISLDKGFKARLAAYSELYSQLKKMGQIAEHDAAQKGKTKLYMERSKNDYLFASAVKKLIDRPELGKDLGLPPAYTNIHHWLIIISYYSMYHAATAAIAAKNVKCESHEATIASLAEHYATEEEIEFDFIKTLHHTYIEYIESGRDKRRGAQYRVDKEFASVDSSQVFDNAGKFVRRIQQILEE